MIAENNLRDESLDLLLRRHPEAAK
jgi:tetratricopeptide (TPR) repeat protein